MSDQCKHCECRGDLDNCLSTPCFHHENWFIGAVLEKHNAEMVAMCDEMHKNVIANFRGVNSEGLYNVKGFINHIKHRIQSEGLGDDDE